MLKTIRKDGFYLKLILWLLCRHDSECGYFEKQIESRLLDWKFFFMIISDPGKMILLTLLINNVARSFINTCQNHLGSKKKERKFLLLWHDF